MLKKCSVVFGLSFLVVVLAGCVSARGTVLNVGGPVYPKVGAAEVRVFLSEAEVPGPFENVGLLRGAGNDFASDGRMLAALRKRAAKMGANGIILGELKKPGAADRALSVLVGLGGLSEKKWTATAIRFKSPA